MAEFDGELMKAIRRVQGQQARIPDLPRLPHVGSDMNRIRLSIEGRQNQVGQDSLLEELTERKRKNKVHLPERGAGVQTAKFLTDKLQTRFNQNPMLGTIMGVQHLKGRNPTIPGGVERRPNQLF
jgi:hypothetical protein